TGWVTARANAVATAASTAFPPLRSISAPISDAIVLAETTMPFRARKGWLCAPETDAPTAKTRRSAAARGAPRRARSRMSIGQFLHACHHAQKVGAEDFLDIPGRKPALQERLGEAWQAGHVFHSDGHRRAV